MYYRVYAVNCSSYKCCLLFLIVLIFSPFIFVSLAADDLLYCRLNFYLFFQHNWWSFVKNYIQGSYLGLGLFGYFGLFLEE